MTWPKGECLNNFFSRIYAKGGAYNRNFRSRWTIFAKFLLGKDFKVYGLIRRCSHLDFANTDYLGITDKIEFISGFRYRASWSTGSLIVSTVIALTFFFVSLMYLILDHIVNSNSSTALLIAPNLLQVATYPPRFCNIFIAECKIWQYV
jgi:hypothetical protein